jgi:hypothetical protein
MKAHEGRSSGDAVSLAGADCVAAGVVSPVRIDSSHSSPDASISRTSAGTMSPTRSRTMSPGTSSVTSTCRNRPPRSTTACRRMRACSSSTAFSARYSFRKPRPMLRAMIATMIVASVLSPTNAETTAAAARRRRR